MLNKDIAGLLDSRQYRGDANRAVCLMPLGSICWDDEMPDFRDLARFSADELKVIWRIFGIRFKIWDGQQLSTEDQFAWDAARLAAPNWALFQRLALSAEDRAAREEVENGVEKDWEEFLRGADEVKVTDEGQGVQSFSATFDLREKPREN